MVDCWRVNPAKRPTFAALEGVVNLVRMPEFALLQARVTKARNWAPASGDGGSAAAGGGPAALHPCSSSSVSGGGSWSAGRPTPSSVIAEDGESEQNQGGAESGQEQAWKWRQASDGARAETQFGSAPCGDEVDRTKLVYLEKLGSGQFGDVWLMATRMFSERGQPCFVAVKTLKQTTDGADELGGGASHTDGHGAPAAQQQSHRQVGEERKREAPLAAALRTANEREFLNEVELMKRLRHPRLVTLLGVCTQERPYMMILEYLPGGSLDQWLPENGAAAHPTGLVRILHQVAEAFVALGAAAIVHRDLAARNVLIDERFGIISSAQFGWGQLAQMAPSPRPFSCEVVRACVCVCVCACVRACVCACVPMLANRTLQHHSWREACGLKHERWLTVCLDRSLDRSPWSLVSRWLARSQARR
jgi:hypothetical protein